MELTAKIAFFLAFFTSFCIRSYGQIDSSWERFHYKVDGTWGAGPGPEGAREVDIRLIGDASVGYREYYLVEGSTFSFRRTSSNGPLTKTYHPMAGFSSGSTENYTQGELWSTDTWTAPEFRMNYRLLTPRGYNTTTHNPEAENGYPMIVMIHGFGERGNCWGNNCYHNNIYWNPNVNNPAAAWNNYPLLNNDHSMTHGGELHQTAVRTTTPAGMLPDDPNMPDRAFPGFILFPQNLNGWAFWDNSAENVIRIIRLLIQQYNINPNKIYIHGLSDGGAGVYGIIQRAPWLFAAALPMSAVNDAEINQYKWYPYINSIPVWTFQGGKDNNPSPAKTEGFVQGFRESGMDVRYTLYPQFYHGIWNDAYKEPDFFSWMMKKDKANIHVKFGNPIVCRTSGAAVNLILAQGFLAYQWEKDGELIPGATSYAFTATLPGIYRARFSRVLNPGTNDWNRWSDPVVVTENAPAKPTIQPLGSTVFPTTINSIGGQSQTRVVLKASGPNEKYAWYKDGIPVSNVRDLNGGWIGNPPDTLSMLMRDDWANPSEHGRYTLHVAYISGCQSVSSDPVFMVHNDNATLTSPGNFAGTAQNASSIFLSWTDSSPNEVGFEIWRRKEDETAYTFVARTPEDAVSYLDTNLTAGTTYQYKIRAVGNTTATARSNYVPGGDVLDTNLPVVTTGDATPPTPPQNLQVTHNTINSISLAWDAGTDNNGIKRYKINYGGSSVFTSSPATTYTITGLPTNNSYIITVQTEDLSGILSSPSNQVIGTTYVEGLLYEYATGAWQALNQIDWTTAEITGKIAGLEQYSGTAIRNLATQNDYFRFKFDGYVNITTAGFNDHYQFRTNSDDGSMLFIGGFNPTDITQFRVVNNDGLHGEQWRETDANSVNVSVPIGFHRIVVLFNEYTGGQSLRVQYRRRTSNNYTTWADLPNSMLRSGTPPTLTPPNAPTSLEATANGMTSINLSWTYSGLPLHNPVAFEVYRSLVNVDSTYAIIGRATGTTFTDNTVIPSTTYYYKLKTISNNGATSTGFSNVHHAKTESDLAAPSVPTALTLISKTFSNVVFSWAASTDNVAVAGYEILVDGIVRDTTAITSHMVTGLAPGTSYSFTVKAFDATGKSNASAALAVTTNSGVPYYSKNNGAALNLTSTWGTNADGTGDPPVSLAYNGQIYNVTRPATGLGGPLVIGGSVSKIIVPAGTTFTVDNTISAKLEVQGNAVINLNNTNTAPEFLSVSPTSTVNFNNYAYIPAGTYGHVNLTGTGNKNFGEGETEIMGNLTATTGIALKGVLANGSHVTVHGDITLAGTPAVVATDNALDLTLVKAGTQNLTVSGALDLYKLSTASGTNVNIVNGGSAITLNVGSPNGGGLALANGTTLNLGNNHLVMKNAATINADGQTGKLAINGSNLTLASISNQNSNLYVDATLKTAGMVTSTFSSTGKLMVQSPLSITDGLKIKAGEVSSAGNITLVSNQTKTAYLQEIEGNGSITGDAKVERWVSAVRKYRYMSSSVANMTVANWQQYMPITGDFTGNSLGSTTPSAFYYVENDGGYKNYPATGSSNAVTFARGRGYSIFNYNGNNSLTLTMTGNPYQGSVPFTLTPGTGSTQNGGDGWNLIGNPYASAIGWNNLTSDWTKSGLNAAVYVPDNSTGSLRFYTYDADTGLGLSGDDYETLEGGIIAPGQAFWVKTTTASPSLTIHEKAKRTNTSTFYREGGPSANHFVVKLSDGTLQDNTFVILGEHYEDTYEPALDGMKRRNDKLNLSTRSSESVNLVFNKLSDSFCEKVIPLNIEDVTPGTYSLSFDNIENLVGIGTIELTDHFTSNTIPVTGSTPYSFAVTADAASYGAGRFSLAIHRPALQKNAVVKIDNLCGGESASVQLTNTQPGVFYYASYENSETPLSEILTGNGGSLALNVSVSALQSGTNNLVVRTGFKGCSNELLSASPIEFTYTPSPLVSVDKAFYSLCEDSQITLKAETNAADNLRWYQDGVLLESQTGSSWISDPIKNTTLFEVAAVVNGCEGKRASTYVEINRVPMPLIEFNGTALEIVNDIPADNFVQWYINNSPVDAYDRGIVPSEEGIYQVLVAKGGCSLVSEPFEFLVSGVENQLGEPFAAYVYPNPAAFDQLYVKMETTSTQEADVKLVDLAGRNVFDVTLSGTEVNGVHKLNVSQDTTPGLYILLIRQGDAVLQRKVILVFK